LHYSPIFVAAFKRNSFHNTLAARLKQALPVYFAMIMPHLQEGINETFFDFSIMIRMCRQKSNKTVNFLTSQDYERFIEDVKRQRANGKTRNL